MANNHFRQGQSSGDTERADSGAKGDGSDSLNSDDLILAAVVAGTIVLGTGIWVMTDDDGPQQQEQPHPSVQQAQQDSNRLEFDDDEESFRRPEDRIGQQDNRAPEFDPDQFSRRDLEPEQLDPSHYEGMAEEIAAEDRPESVRDTLPDGMYDGVDVEAVQQDAASIRSGQASPQDYIDQGEMLPDEVHREVDVDEIMRQQGGR